MLSSEPESMMEFDRNVREGIPGPAARKYGWRWETASKDPAACGANIRTAFYERYGQSGPARNLSESD